MPVRNHLSRANAGLIAGLVILILGLILLLFWRHRILGAKRRGRAGAASARTLGLQTRSSSRPPSSAPILELHAVERGAPPRLPEIRRVFEMDGVRCEVAPSKS